MKAKSLKQRAWNAGSKFLLLFLIVCAATASAAAATVRGRLDRRDAYGNIYRAAYVGVTLNNQYVGRSSMTYTGEDGMYYLYNVPPGSYYLEVWIQPGRQPLVYQVQVGNAPFSDIPPILLP